MINMKLTKENWSKLLKTKDILMIDDIFGLEYEPILHNTDLIIYAFTICS